MFDARKGQIKDVSTRILLSAQHFTSTFELNRKNFLFNFDEIEIKTGLNQDKIRWFAHVLLFLKKRNKIKEKHNKVY